ncbi:hypothetical protein [Microcella sp.]|uniref:hypothetical protein n=1 Tax=Microcella sp. TaxID=1913979 RepID=UPI00391D7504
MFSEVTHVVMPRLFVASQDPPTNSTIAIATALTGAFRTALIAFQVFDAAVNLFKTTAVVTLLARAISWIAQA